MGKLATNETIAAIATPPGKGGVGVVRISGPEALNIAQMVVGRLLPVRQAVYAKFQDHKQQPIDSGIALYFAGPHSFTGEDVVELHGHGGPIIQDVLLAELMYQGARPARAGEFSERAFLNDKIDLAQAEAIADLIDSTTAAAARGAVKSLQGEFSNKIDALQQELIELRVYVEAAIDFPEEEIDFLADEGIRSRIKAVRQHLASTLEQAGQGAILRNGLSLVLAGKPNAGKSSLLNSLAGEQTAIVTDVPGTTRDIIRQTISIDGLPVHLIDTAGLRDSQDTVEQIGVARARAAIDAADHVLHLVDAQDLQSVPEVLSTNTSLVVNKIDLIDNADTILKSQPDALLISVTQGDGLLALQDHIKAIAGYQPASETTFTARRRHITALEKARNAVDLGLRQLETSNAGELLADELRQAQDHLAEITGQFSADDLLGEIFAGFCIGK